MGKGATVAILTALDLEYEEVRTHLRDVKPHSHPAGTRWEIGTIADGSCRIAIADAGQGNLSSAVLAERTCSEFELLALFFVGVAGALKDDVDLGDVVVANRVYAYQGGASEDDEFRARPRAWDAPHWLDQLAGDITRSGSWKSRLRSEDGPEPKAVRAPIAAGEAVLKSRTSAEAHRIRQHYNNAAAIEMEGAGVAQAAQLNSFPSMLIRGISDYADNAKHRTDRAGWQPIAAKRAAAFAITLAARAAEESAVRESTGAVGTRGRRNGGNGATGGGQSTFTNLAQGNAHVGIQAGQILGDAYVGGSGPDRDLNIEQELKYLRLALENAHRAGRIDDDTHESAQAELTIATEACPTGNEKPANRFVLALKRLKGLLEGIADFGAKITTILDGIGQAR